MKHLKVGLVGKARCGKDTVARHLVEHHGFTRNAFADPLKRAGQQMFMLTEEQTWDDKLKEKVIDYWGMSPRHMFQKLGTEGGRDVFGHDLWLKRWSLHFQVYGPVTSYVVPDVRFENEAELLRSFGFTIVHIESDRASPLDASAKVHASEAGVKLDPLHDIVLLNNTTLSTLYAKVDQLVEWLEKLRG